MNCGKIYSSIIKDCNFVSYSGDKLYLIHYDDILYVQFYNGSLSMTRSPGEYRDLVNIVLYGGKTAKYFEGKNDSIVGGFYKFELLYSDTFVHSIDFVAVSNGVSTKKQLDLLKQGKYVAIIYSSLDDKYTVYGLYSGLYLKNNVRSLLENQGAYSLEFETSDGESEPNAPFNFTGDITRLLEVRWILWDGWWDDGGIWIDTETWND